MVHKIGVVLATRGLVFTKVEMSLTDNLAGYDYRTYRSYDLKIPDCQNVLVEEALRDGCTHILFVEEDTVMPKNSFAEMIKADGDIVAIDYAVSGWSCITKSKDTGEILWCGLGCTLIKREVFDALPKPYFRSDKALLLNDWPTVRWIDSGNQAYGGQDIYFCIKAREAGFAITQLPGECDHLKLAFLGRREINNGLHSIEIKDRISKYQTL